MYSRIQQIGQLHMGNDQNCDGSSDCQCLLWGWELHGSVDLVVARHVVAVFVATPDPQHVVAADLAPSPAHEVQ